MTHLLKAALIAAASLLLAACTPGEGERCNPLQFSNECGSGYSCTVPPNCAVAYCCPTSGASENPNCQACAAPGDGGTDSGD